MASKPLSNDEAKNLMKQLGMAEASARDEDRVAKGGSSTSEARNSRTARTLLPRHGPDFGPHGFGLAVRHGALVLPEMCGKGVRPAVEDGIGPGRPFGHGKPDGRDAATPHRDMSTATAVTIHEASGYCAARLASAEKRKSITVCSISICLPAGRTPRRAAVRVVVHMNPRRGQLDAPEPSFKQRLKDGETGMGINTADVHGVTSRMGGGGHPADSLLCLEQR